MTWIDASTFALLLSSPVVGLAIGRMASHSPGGSSFDLTPRSAASASIAPERLLAFRWSMGVAGLLIAVASVSVFDPSRAWIASLLGWALLASAASDALHLLLPNALMAAIAAGGLAECALSSPDQLPDRVLGGLGAFAALRLLGGAFARLRGYAGIGAGDSYLLGALGFWLGWWPLPHVCLIASVAAAGWIFLRGRARRSQASGEVVPFGVFLAPVGWIAWTAMHAFGVADSPGAP